MAKTWLWETENALSFVPSGRWQTLCLGSGAEMPLMNLIIPLSQDRPQAGYEAFLVMLEARIREEIPF